MQEKCISNNLPPLEPSRAAMGLTWKTHMERVGAFTSDYSSIHSVNQGEIICTNVKIKLFVMCDQSHGILCILLMFNIFINLEKKKKIKQWLFAPFSPYEFDIPGGTIMSCPL